MRSNSYLHHRRLLFYSAGEQVGTGLIQSQIEGTVLFTTQRNINILAAMIKVIFAK